MKTLGIILLTGVMLSSCCGSKEVVENTSESHTTQFVTETVHDTVFVVKADTSTFSGELKVDSTGKISLINTSSTSSKNIKAPKVQIKDNKIHIDCETYAQELLAQWKSKNIETTSTNNNVKTIIKEVERDPSWWENLEIWFGRIFMILLIVTAIGLILFRLKK